MSRKTRRNHSPAFKAKVALAAVQGDAALVELSKRFDVRPNQLATWKERLIASAPNAFGGDTKVEPAADLKTLHAKIRPTNDPGMASPPKVRPTNRQSVSEV